MFSKSFVQGPVASARLLVLILIGVVASFLLATGLSEYRQSAIDRRVDDMVVNAMPSVQYLSRARTELRRLDEELVASIVLGVKPDPEGWKKIEALRQTLEPTFKSYAALPFFPVESQMFEGLVRARVGELDAALGTHRVAEAHRAVGRLDDGLQQLVDFDAAEGQRLGIAIQHVRQQSMNALLVAEVLTVGLAAVATLLASRNHRRTIMLLEERSRELEDFAGRAAHDLRAPLNAMSMRLQLSARKPAADTPVLQLQRYVQRMSGMIDGLLEFARAGAQPQPGQHATVGVILRDTVEALSPEAEEAGVALRLEGDADVAVACAPGMVTSVVTNLARNALKYIHAAHRADPRITLRVREHGDHVRVEVEDTGPGIPREAQESIFKPFVRLSSDQPGSGLGLAIVKRIVEAHRGAVGVESTPGVGSCFWFELPA